MYNKIVIVFLVLIGLFAFSNSVFSEKASVSATTNHEDQATTAVKEKQTTVGDEEKKVSEASEPTYQDPGFMVDNLINKYRNDGPGKAISDEVEKKGGWIGSSTAEVGAENGPENPQWAKYRVMAYEKALFKVENDYIKTRYRAIKAEKLSEFYKAASDEVPDFKPEDMDDPSKEKIILEKILAATEGKLDKVLDDLGVDKEQFNKTLPPQRYILLRESLSKSTFVKASGDLAGLIPIQTFEGFNSQKEHVIGVLCIVTPKTKQFSYDILHNRGQFTPSDKKGKDLYELLSKDDNKLINQFGIRKMTDKDGYPVLISFGQWANSKNTEDKKLNRRYRDAAQKQAEASAQNQIAIYLAGIGGFQSESEINETFEDAYNVNQDNFADPDMINKIMDGVIEKSKRNAQATITGLKTLYSWTIKHPLYGNEIVGVIMIWSPQDEKAIRELGEMKVGKIPSSPKKEIKGTSGTKTGEEYMDKNDF